MSSPNRSLHKKCYTVTQRGLKNMAIFDICQYCNQVLTLAWKNGVLKLRNYSTLLFELAVPVLIIYALVIVKQQIKPTTDKATLPSNVLYTGRMKVLSSKLNICTPGLINSSAFLISFKLFQQTVQCIVKGHRSNISSQVEEPCMEL